MTNTQPNPSATSASISVNSSEGARSHALRGNESYTTMKMPNNVDKDD